MPPLIITLEGLHRMQLIGRLVYVSIYRFRVANRAQLQCFYTTACTHNASQATMTVFDSCLMRDRSISEHYHVLFESSRGSFTRV